MTKTSAIICSISLAGALLLVSNEDGKSAEVTAAIKAQRDAELARSYSTAWVDCLNGRQQVFDDGRTLYIVPCETMQVRAWSSAKEER